MTDPAPSTSSERMVTLVSNDDETFQVARNVLKQSDLINIMITDSFDDSPEDQKQKIPLPSINAAILKMVIQFMEHHRNDPVQADGALMLEDIPQWDKDFLKVDQATLQELIRAGDYLDIKGLLTACCMTVADMIKDKSPLEIGEIFDIENELTPEEEEEAIRRENAWSED